MPANGERPTIPPLRKPVSEYPTPSHVVAFYTELVNRDDPAYIANAPVKRGSRYSTMVGAKRDVIQTYPNLFFLQETKYQMDDQKVLWHWATDENAHDTYNADVTYVANAITYPAFTRVYTTRRELYESEPTLPIGSPLPGIIAVEITSPGQNHTEARGVIDGTSVAIDFVVDSNGSLVSAVITDTGETLIPNGTPITIIGDGQDSSAIAVTQPVGCVLTAQKKEELPDQDPLQHELVKVTRVYETLPGPWIYSTRIDKDGLLVTTKTRRQVADFITDKDEVIQNGTGYSWIQTWHKGSDNFVAEETVESRDIPGNPLISTTVAEDGITVTREKYLQTVAAGVTEEKIVAGVWEKAWTEELSSTTFAKDTQATNKVIWQIVELRVVPGNPMVEIKIDKDGIARDVVKTLKDTTTIVQGEVIGGGGVWITTEKEPVSDLVAWEVVTARTVAPNGAANPVLSYQIDQDHETVFRQTILKDRTTIIPGASEFGGNITTVAAEEVTDLVANEVTEVKTFLDAASYSISIENLIPREFRAFIPTFVESHILSGTASMQVLGVGDFEISEKQLTKLLYERRVTSLGPISLPITHTNQEITEEYGGGVLNVIITLDTTGVMTIDQGYLVTRSTLTVLGNGMDLKETAQLDGTEWPILTSRLWDENMRQIYVETQQVVPFGSLPDPDPGVFAWLSEIRKLDTWRSIRINTNKSTPAYTDESNALISYAYKPYRFPGLVYTLTGGVGYYVRQADATLVQHKIKTWWVKSGNPPPTPVIDEIIQDSPVINGLNDLSSLTYTNSPTLHDNLIIRTLFYPATTPSYTQYALGTPDGTFTLNNVMNLFSPGTVGGYNVGDVVFANSGGFSASITVTVVYDVGTITGLILNFTQNGGNYPPGSYGPIIGTGGSGSGAIFNVFSFETPNYTPGTAWIGTYRVIGASVTPEKEIDVWKYQTESVVMR